MELKLPSSIATRRDLAQIHRELRVFYDMGIQSIMRHDNPVKYPAISESLRQLAVDNQIDIRQQDKCKKLIEDLELVKSKATSVHISFSVEPSKEVLDRLVGWFRREVDQNTVISVGLQPTIAAGVIVRTPNHQFDFSLRKHLEANKDKLNEAISSVQ